MRFAAVETSTQWCSVAVWDAGEIVSLERQAGNRHSELVMPMLERVLESKRMTFQEIDGVAFQAFIGHLKIE